jgi:ribosomal protein S18 acetylase RimI-like enzyme
MALAFATRRAELSDADAIALAHLDSIRSLGAAFYPPRVVDDWVEGIEGALYRNAMTNGEVFFIATGIVDGADAVLGFSSDYRSEGASHGTSVYVRGRVARMGIGSALLGLAEAHAVSKGAERIQIEASLGGVEFYRANGFVEVSRGETQLATGRPIACVFMRKELGRNSRTG